MDIKDGSYTIVLSNRGQNREEVSEELADFLDYTREKEPIINLQIEDSYVNQIEESIQKIKASREMGARYMLLQELLQDERAEGRNEGRKERNEEITLRLSARGNSVAEIADILGTSVKEVVLWLDKGKNNN